MSEIIATITEINSVDNLNIVKFDFYGIALKMMSLDLSEDIKVGKQVQLTVKPTHIVVAKNFSGMLSLSNKIQAKVISFENGKLLSSVKLAIKDIILESIITVTSVLEMNLKVDDEVTIMIQESELSIAKVL